MLHMVSVHVSYLKKPLESLVFGYLVNYIKDLMRDVIQHFLYLMSNKEPFQNDLHLCLWTFSAIQVTVYVTRAETRAETTSELFGAAFSAPETEKEITNSSKWQSVLASC